MTLKITRKLISLAGIQRENGHRLPTDEDENGHGDNNRHDFGLILSRSLGPPTSNQPSDTSCHFQISPDFTQTLIEPKKGMKTFCKYPYVLNFRVLFLAVQDSSIVDVVSK